MPRTGEESEESLLFAIYSVIASSLLISLFFGAIIISVELKIDFFLACALLIAGLILLVMLSWWMSRQRWAIWILNRMAGSEVFGLEEKGDTLEN